MVRPPRVKSNQRPPVVEAAAAAGAAALATVAWAALSALAALAFVEVALEALFFVELEPEPGAPAAGVVMRLGAPGVGVVVQDQMSLFSAQASPVGAFG